MKDWLMELCPEIAEWQAEIIAEQVQREVAAEREACAKVSLRPPQPAIFLSENISHAQFMAQFEEGDQS